MSRLIVSLVTYRPDLELLGRVLVSLSAAAERAVEEGRVRGVELIVVDNGPGEGWREPLERVAASWPAPLGEWRLLSGHGNVGYGGGHNLAFRTSAGDYHLVLNPDVLMEPEALSEGIGFLDRRGEVALLAPLVVDEGGRPGHLCKASPTVWDLFLRGFAPRRLRERFRARMARYEMADLPLDRPVFDPPLVSGCFMLIRGRALRAVGGFDERFFMYFEDFDLTLRLTREGRVVLLPAMRIRHFGGGASRKGLAHVRMFIVSAWRYFRLHGWRWW